MISKRKIEDDADDLAAIYGTLPIAIPTESNGMDESSLSPADLCRQRRVARVARRQLRRSQHQHDQHEEGYSTDSSLLNSDSLAYSDAIKSLTSRAKDILADVKAEEFKDPGKGRWNIWREKYSDSYIGAWGGLGVVSVWEFWVRLECLGWNCIAVSGSTCLSIA